MKKLILILICFTGVCSFSSIFGQEKDTLKADDILRMSFTDLMNVKIISASKIQQHIKDVPATVQVITAEQIREFSYFTLEEALSDLPGFQFRNIVGFNSYVFMRGAPSQNNLIILLIDGVQVNELNSGGFYGGGQFNLSDIERIEVIYGPASALYGTNAVSGVINLITKSTEGKGKGHVSILGGNFNTGMLDFNVKNYNVAKDIGFSISGLYKTSEKADLRGAKGDHNWTDDMQNFENDNSLSGKLKIKDFNAGIVYQDKKASMTTNTLSVGDPHLDKNTLWDIAFLNGFIKYSNDKHEKWTFSSMLYYRNASVKPNTIGEVIKATDTTPGNQIGYYRPNQLFGLENQFNYKVSDKVLFITGLIGEFEQLSDGFSYSNSNSQFTAPAEPSKPKVLNNNLISYFIQGNIKLLSKLSLIAGWRHDFSNYYGQVFTPRTGLVFNDKKITAKVLYNRAFRAPKPWDYKYGLGNSDLKPEKMQSFELDFAYLIMDNLSMGTSVYKNLINDKLTKVISTNGSQWINKNKLNTLGCEIYINYSIKNFLVYANYTYSDSYDQDDVFIPEISLHTANAGFTYSINRNFKINLRTNYLGERKNNLLIPNTGNNIIDDALLLHGCISYFNLKGFDFQLKVNNILDQEYYHPSNLFAGRFRQPQRNFTLKVAYNF